MDLSKIEADRYNIDRSIQDINVIFRTTIDYLKPIFEEKNIKVKNYLPEDLPHVFIDKDKIIQVITNLLSNAIKFTPENGYITIDGSKFTQGKKQKKINKDFIQIDITDTGIGLPAKQLDKIFEKFYQIDQSSTREYKGTGLGLAITKKIIDLHGGEIWAESKKRAGSTFSFTIPKSKD